MAQNTNLHAAKTAKNDEFYTQLTDIEKELKRYRKFLKGKIVYCNCDDPTMSEFTNYFLMNYVMLGLKKLICVGYREGGHGICGIYEGFDTKDGNYTRNGYEMHVYELEDDGDFRSEESIAFLKEADVVITNPPFSLFREYVAQLIEYDKKFLIIGNMNAITYKEIFPLIKDSKIWCGYEFNASFIFKAPYENTLEANRDFVKQHGYDPDDGFIKVPAINWYTNIPIKRLNTPLDLYKKYTPEEYPKYDNYDAIEVSKVIDIPVDYNGVMGVPITFLGGYCPEQFEILGIANSARWIGDFPCLTIIDGIKIYNRILIKHKNEN